MSHSIDSSFSSLIDQATRFAEKLRPDAFELYFVKRSSLRIDSRDLKVDTLTQSEDVGLSARIIHQKRLGFSFTTSLHPEAIEKAIQSAFEIACVMPEDEATSLADFSQYKYTDIENWDQAGLNTPTAQKIELALELEAECRKADPRIRGVRASTLTEGVSQSCLVDSRGNRLFERGTYYTVRISCRAEENGESQSGGDFGFSHQLNDLNWKSVALNSAQRATELLGAGAAPTLTCPAVLRNNVVADLVDFLSASFSAEQIAKGRSMLAGKRHQRIFSPSVTLMDDGLLPGGLATSAFDGEGIPCQKTRLVHEGLFENTLCDLYYSKKTGDSPTGNAVRSIKAPPSIGTSNLYMEKGNASPDELFQGIQRGILITNLLGLHTANSVTGDFSLGASGLLIENGKITRPVRGFAIAGNILGLFRKMSDIGNDLRFFGSTGAPSVRVTELSVGGK